MILFADSSAGTHTPTNQDSVFAELLHDARHGHMVFAVVADGMGGMARGEVASATVANHFATWLRGADLTEVDPKRLRHEWCAVAEGIHEALVVYSDREHITLGSTATVLLLAAQRYHIMNVGDTRCYEIADGIRQLTEDHSLVALEVRRGQLSQERARTDARQNVLLQCLGAGASIQPDFFTGPAAPDARYLVCTDGLRHLVSDDEIGQVLAQGPASLAQLQELIKLNRDRGETDDISAVLIQNSPQGGTNPLESRGTTGGTDRLYPAGGGTNPLRSAIRGRGTQELQPPPGVIKPVQTAGAGRGRKPQ
ncbi:MAG: protein phosphatase 2C domain-containing protein [Bifidobacteriaceae bacterium]|jgi:serine/threonine protein phosphatase PrpC|nr:protein phosphatase 2C domain-containing protein [Bifidobacteriaceae bacterium]